MIRCDDNDHMTRQSVHLKEQRADDTFNLTCFVLVTSLLADDIELIEEQHCPAGAHMIKQTCQPKRGLSQVTCNYCLIPDHKEGDHELCRDYLGQGSFSVAWRPSQKYPMSRLQIV